MHGGDVPWPAYAVSWWYVPDQNWPLLVDTLAQHLNVVTSVIHYCGQIIAYNGSIMSNMSEYCSDGNGGGVMPALASLGIRNELWLQGSVDDIQSYRTLWGDTTHSIAALVDIAQQYRLDGWNIDIEPSSSTADDAVVYAHWLSVLKSALHEIGVRLTVDVATWSPVLAQFETLAPAVDRLMDMEVSKVHRCIP